MSLPLSVTENPAYSGLRSSVRRIGAALRKGLDRDAPAKSLTARREASKRRPVKSYIPITDEMLAELRGEFDRTGARPAALFRGRPASLSGLTEIKISHWRTGRVRRADPAEWAYVIDALKSLPTIPEKGKLPTDVGAALDDPPPVAPLSKSEERWLSRRRLTPKAGSRMKLEDSHIAALFQERKRTGIGPIALANNAPCLPEGLNGPIINTWMIGKTKSCCAAHYEYVLARYRELPDAPRFSDISPRMGRIEVTPAMRKELNTLFEETGVAITSIIRHYKSPESKLTAAKISHWRTGRVKFADPEEWNHLILVLRAFKK